MGILRTHLFPLGLGKIANTIVWLKLLRDLRNVVTKNPNFNAEQKRLEVEKLRETENMIAH